MNLSPLFADAQDAPFHATPHFAHWVPLEGPQHLLVVSVGARPALIAVKPEDCRHEQTPLGRPFWLDAFDVHELADVAAAWKLAHVKGRTAYVSEMLLHPRRTGETKDEFDWALIDRLTPCGGIRIEDNVLVTREGHPNLTRRAI